eukprot:4046517-Amphidinium_carterae.1
MKWRSKESVEGKVSTLDRNGYQHKGSSTANLNSCQTAAWDIKTAKMHTWRFSKTSYGSIAISTYITK